MSDEQTQDKVFTYDDVETARETWVRLQADVKWYEAKYLDAHSDLMRAAAALSSANAAATRAEAEVKSTREKWLRDQRAADVAKAEQSIASREDPIAALSPMPEAGEVEQAFAGVPAWANERWQNDAALREFIASGGQFHTGNPHPFDMYTVVTVYHAGDFYEETSALNFDWEDYECAYKILPDQSDEAKARAAVGDKDSPEREGWEAHAAGLPRDRIFDVEWHRIAWQQGWDARAKFVTPEPQPATPEQGLGEIENTEGLLDHEQEETSEPSSQESSTDAALSDPNSADWWMRKAREEGDVTIGAVGGAFNKPVGALRLEITDEQQQYLDALRPRDTKATKTPSELETQGSADGDRVEQTNSPDSSDAQVFAHGILKDAERKASEPKRGLFNFGGTKSFAKAPT